MRDSIKQLVDGFIKFILVNFNKWHLKRIEKYDLEIPYNQDNYEALIPNTQDKKKTFYNNPFSVALKTPNVNNIAITGSYGSGKSSFLRKFEKENAEWNYLPISLAAFANTENDNISITGEGDNNNKIEENSNKDTVLYQDIERSILQQFFYREKDKTIPFSRFKKIKKVLKVDILLLSTAIPYLYLYIFRPKLIQNLLPDVIIKFTHDYNYIFLGLAILLFLSGFYRLLYFLGSFQVSKFDVKKNSITIAQQDKASILNEHLDEIIYFFEATNYNVVIFEDIDRFNNTEIFVKLRELNNLINNSKQINRRVIFIYAIRDDMFVDKERTKFFDFIVPIIPYINPSNSEQKLIDKFKKEIDTKSLNEHFLTQISWYIDDMRLLINIYNEYMIYKNNLNSDKLDHNKLLALIVCKNFYPLDFAELHVREGAIYKLFENKPKYIEKQIEQYEHERSQLLQQIKSIKNENIHNLEELKIIYLGRLFSETNADAITIPDTDYTQKIFSDLLKTDLLDEIDSDTTCEIYIKECYNYSIRLSNTNQKKFGDIESLIDDNNSYKKRKELIKGKINNKIDELKKEIGNVDKNINRLKNSSLKKLFETSFDYIVTDDYQDRDLLIFLVRNGYIDEHYEYYISYFHEGGITQDDREFLLSIQNHKPLNFISPLGNVSKLMEKLDEKDFESEYILNNQLTSYLLKSINSNKKEKYFQQLSNGSNKSIEFIFHYMEYASDDEKKLFINQLTWDGLWLYIYENLSKKEQNKYFKLLFNTLEVDRLIALSIEAYLSEQTVMPKYEEDNIKCQELISILKVDFEYINNPLDNLPLFTYIYENGYYEFNPKMVEIIMLEKGNLEDSKIDKLNYKNLTIIRESEAEKLIELIDKHIDIYYEGIFNELDENKQESEDTLLYLLNHEGLDNGKKESIIQKIETKIGDISSIKDNNLWAILLQENKVIPSWDNLLFYYQNMEEPEVDDVLINYLNIEDNYLELSKTQINNEDIFDKDEILSPFNAKLLVSNNLTDEAYTYLIKSIWFVGYKDLALNELSMSKVENILLTNRLSLTQDNIIRLKDDFSPKHIDLIANNKEDFLDDLDSFELDSDDILRTTNCTKFTKEELFKIVEHIDLTLFDENKELKEKVSKLYIDNNKKIESINLFDKLFYGENKYDLGLLVFQIDYFEECSIIKPYLDGLTGYDDAYKELVDIDGSKLYLEDTTLNRSLLNKLKNKDCISSWKENKRTLGANNLKVERKRV